MPIGPFFGGFGSGLMQGLEFNQRQRQQEAALALQQLRASMAVQQLSQQQQQYQQQQQLQGLLGRSLAGLQSAPQQAPLSIPQQTAPMPQTGYAQAPPGFK